MARKTKEEALATRDGILDAALECFHEFGIAGTSLAAIGQRAGYSRGAVYWHFRNKAEILEAMINRQRTPFIKRLRRAYSPDRNTPVQDLRSAMLVSLDELAGDPCLRRMMEIMLRNDLSAESAAMRRLQSDYVTEEMGIFHRALERAQALQQLHAGVDTQKLARILHATLTGIMTGAMLLKPAMFDLAGDSRDALDALLSYYVKPGVFTAGAQPETLPAIDPA